MILRVKVKENEKRRGWWDRLKQVLPFVSAAIVLGTFVVHDMLRERYKDLADDIAREQDAFAIRTEVESVATRQEEIRSIIDDQIFLLQGTRDTTTESSGKNRTKEASLEIVRSMEDAEKDDRDYSQLLASYDNTMSLYEALPYDKQLDGAHWAAKIVLDRTRMLMDAHRHAEPSILSDTVGAQVAYISQAAFYPEHVVEEFADKVLGAARKERDRAQKRSLTWRHISFGLYPLGVIVGLLGKLFGDEDLEGVEV